MVSQDRHLKGFNFPTELPSSHLPASFEYTLQRFDQRHLSEDAPNIDPSVEPSHDPPSVSPPSVKILAYADDALVFLKDAFKCLAQLQQDPSFLPLGGTSSTMASLPRRTQYHLVA
ncbi:hypothetical protein G6F33_014265 [Rhizopus arrhizus]|nr:hypothetical protein G6F33_014265 [Rhizopus arrhizus]KAG0920228.1 hypothetical protein G6F32_015700 [Rhizopus arrhizus]